MHGWKDRACLITAKRVVVLSRRQQQGKTPSTQRCHKMPQDRVVDNLSPVKLSAGAAFMCVMFLSRLTRHWLLALQSVKVRNGQSRCRESFVCLVFGLICFMNPTLRPGSVWRPWIRNTRFFFFFFFFFFVVVVVVVVVVLSSFSSSSSSSSSSFSSSSFYLFFYPKKTVCSWRNINV